MSNNKKLVLTIHPLVYLQRKGHRKELSHIACDISLFNGRYYHDDPDKYIEQLFNGSLIKDRGIVVEQSKNDSAVYNFGSANSGKYIEYGNIIKTIIL